MYKLLLLTVAALALVAVASAQVFLTYPQTYAPYYTYPSYPYSAYPLTYNPYISLLRR